MKKMLRIAAALAALLAMTNFIGCSSDDDDGGDSGNTSQSGGSGETGGSTSGSTEKIDLSGKYYEVDFGENLHSCIYFETASSGTIWVVNDDRTGSTKKTFTYVTKPRADTIKAIDITWEGASEATEAVFSTPNSYEYLQVKVAWADDSEPWDYFAVSEKPTIPGESGSGSSSGSTSGSTEKINLTINMSDLDFSTTTSGLTNTAASGKNGTFMIPASTKILDVLTPSKDDKAFWYTDKALSKISSLQLNADGELNFTLSGAATVKVTFLSTGDNNTSSITVNGTQNSVTGKTAAEFTWEIAEAGDYTIASTATSNARITALSIVEK